MSSTVSAITNEDRSGSKAQSLKRLKNRRKIWLKVHLWLGLILGFVLAIVGLSGAVLVFWHEIDEVLNPGLYQTAAQLDKLKPLDDIIAAGNKAAPPGYDSAWIQVPEHAEGTYIFGFYYPDNSPPPLEAQSIHIAVDPYTAEVKQQRVFYHGWNPLKHSFVGFFFKLHYALFLGEIGGTLVGICAVFFLISTLTGLILWWPLTGKWRRALTIKRNASAERLNHDLHQTGGFYSALVLLAVLVSGMYFNLGDQFRWLVALFSPLTPEPIVTVSAPEIPVSLQNVLQQARKEFPGGHPEYYTMNDKQGLFTACYRDVPELERYVVASRCLTFSRADGKLLQIKDAEHGSGGDLFMQWQWPLHSGQAFGWTGRILVFIAGLICPMLFVTGVIRWLQKRRAKTAKL